MTDTLLGGGVNALLAENLVEAENAKDYERLLSVISTEAVLHPGSHRGTDAIRGALLDFYRAFPDHRREVERSAEADDALVVHWRMTGTHLGDWNGHAATGRPISIEGCSIWAFAALRVREMWCFIDRDDLLAQLGLAPTAADSGTAAL